MTDTAIRSGRAGDLMPGLIAAVGFALLDVFGKVALVNGADVLTLSTIRGVLSVAFMVVWLRLNKPPLAHTPRQRWIALGVGSLFAAIVFCLYAAMRTMPVPITILAYFVYPLLTGLVGALFGIDKVSWRGIAAAAVAFAGLALTVGAEPGGIALSGILLVAGAAIARTAMLLVTRVYLQGTDNRLTTWYSFVASTAIFCTLSVATWTWQPPQNQTGWIALGIVTASIVLAVLTLFVSISRIGPFRSALIMNLEPLITTILSAPLLGEVLTPVQALGGAITLGALVMFQARR